MQLISVALDIVIYHKKISTSKPTKVRNDTTGNWKLSKIATTDDILEYAKSYYDNNFTSDDEIHAIVNFTLNTTTCVSTLFDNIISVTIHEYVDKCKCQYIFV